ncbi:MAG: folylpolyglutamate synthase/dihydrofolate synthase family protein [Bacteroidales bacterium]|jgi:dihydrofolate synthase/folylpolyglutamate synthase|nr:folylpolyglutamate synthase/dihydrofolate synthase family protein [Bacteroidales bacterium]
MDYRQTLDFMYSQLPMFQRIGPAAYKADLSNTIKLCKLLGNPENSFRSVHIAGTNGKGSVSHMIASVLQEAGYKTGLYTSPHLKDFRERIKINGQMVTEDFVVDFITRYKEEFISIGLSFFEMTVGMAFQYFKEEKVDIAIIETGMGGRLDSTNVLSPLLSVITNIGYDHTQFLGDTLEKIAAEKAAIIKKGIPAIIGETQPGVDHVFIKKAKEVYADLTFADRLDLPEVKPDLQGDWQKRNSFTAVAALVSLKGIGFEISEAHIRAGIKNTIPNTGLLGRWQTLKKKPLAICDIGHNRDGIREVLKMIRQTPHNKLHFVLGLVADKNMDPVLQLLPMEATYYFCKADIPRGLDAEELKTKAAQFNLQGKSYPSVKAAYVNALEHANESDLVFVGGSTFVVAEIL